MKVCTCCFSDIELISFISSNSAGRGRCDYCKGEKNSETIDIKELLDFFQSLFKLFKIQEKGNNLVSIIQEDWGLFKDEITAKKILSDILPLIDTSFSKGIAQNVTYSNTITHSLKNWDKIKCELKWKRRFTIDFEEFKKIYPLYSIISDKRGIITINPNTKNLFRARIHLNGRTNKYDLAEMGAPPKKEVLAGRANPQGIPFLYLSETEETTLYEVKALHYDEISVGTFEIIKPIRLIDFTPPPKPSKVSIFEIFGESQQGESQQFEYLEEFVMGILLKEKISGELSRPQRRYDSELEYIPTQFICEYIKTKMRVDGIKFSSSLDSKKGNNIVLFDTNKVKCTSVKKVRVNKIEIDSERF